MAKTPQSVGGTVVEVAECKCNAGMIYIRFCSSEPLGPNTRGPVKFGSVLVFRCDNAEKVEFGDYVWYIGKKVCWTPKAHADKPEGLRSKAIGKHYDIKLDRIGELNKPHPDKVVDVKYPSQIKPK